MHSFLIFCVLALAVCVWFLMRRMNAHNAALSVRAEEAIGQLGDFISESGELRAVIHQESEDTKLILNGMRLAHELLSQSHMERAGEQTEFTSRIDSGMAALKASVAAEFMQSESKVLDLTDGCERIDADLSLVISDVRELVKMHGDESKELSQRLAQIAEDQDKIRRKSAQRGSGGTFEMVRNGVEKGSYLKTDPEVQKLVDLAEGPESV